MHSPESERIRLEALYALDVLDSDPEPGFDAITQLAASLFHTPVSAVSLIDAERQWFKSCVGIDNSETPREDSICDYALDHDQGLVLLDASRDPDFCNHPVVAPDDGIRFYAGALVRFNGVPIGTLCVADTVPRDAFSDEERQTLTRLANAVSSMLAMRKDGLVKKATIRSLRETQSKLEMMERAAGVGYWHLDMAAQTIQWSRGVYDIFGETPDTYTPRLGGSQHRYHPDDWPMIRGHIEGAMNDGKPFEFDARMSRSDGAERVVHVQGGVESDDNGKTLSIFGTFQDITRQKEVEDALRTAKQTAEDFGQAQADFLSNMSHEIRTPLTTIIGYSGLLDEIEAMPPEGQMFVKRLRKAGGQLLSLVNDILDYSKLEAGQVELDPQPVDLHELADDITDQFRTQAESKGLALKVEADPACPQWIEADGVRLTQVLNNLISNACKFTQAGSVTVRFSGTPSVDGLRLRLEVEDTGPGMSPEQTGRLFKRFSQADNSVHRKHGGSGLGLSICHEISRLMHGQVGCESEEGRGSLFWFEGDVGLYAESETATGADLAGLNILVVDDHEANRDMIRGMLGRDIAMTEAADGAQALELCRSQRFDVILMDIQMPVLDGLSATRELRRLDGINSQTPVIAISAGASVKSGVFDAFLAKPLDKTALLHAIEQVLTASTSNRKRA
ncbi:hypothetical protein ABAC460_06370 [Asticcacaulis sp. AC460]|uniref:GAF domain-containing hybrid sensor histidine kinase/response regulator n=1 Tax=Asticcacaulis sp. AC460 TaxID=1282360 RepID=UPI0003C3D8FC|nr:ATP-binding protein [Asticcacaulis sp. AC460]ESQ91183.1 hypothetical protein ABAC460_06370 [Asticcacaulis sp. AC460]